MHRFSSARRAASVAFAAMAILVLILLLFWHNNLSGSNGPSTTRNIETEVDLAGLGMDDPSLIAHIRRYHLQAPSTRLYKLKNPSAVHYAQFDQSEIVANLFASLNYSRGTFFEAGAHDGEEFSNSLYFERSLGWKGLLVEPNPRSLDAIRSTHRHAMIGACCISGGRPTKLKLICPFGEDATCQMSGTAEPSSKASLREIANDPSTLNAGVWCFPLYSILLAANMTEVDYMVIDLEGHEMTVLEAVPFDKLAIKVIQLEFGLLDASGKFDEAASAKRVEEFRAFFRAKWPVYKEWKLLKIDLIFVHSGLLNL